MFDLCKQRFSPRVALLHDYPLYEFTSREKVTAMAEIVIFGAGDIARLAHFYFSTDTEHEVVAFTVDPAYRTADTFLDLPLVPFEQVGRALSAGRLTRCSWR